MLQTLLVDVFTLIMSVVEHKQRSEDDWKQAKRSGPEICFLLTQR